MMTIIGIETKRGRAPSCHTCHCMLELPRPIALLVENSRDDSCRSQSQDLRATAVLKKAHQTLQEK